MAPVPAPKAKDLSVVSIHSDFYLSTGRDPAGRCEQARGHPPPPPHAHRLRGVAKHDLMRVADEAAHLSSLCITYKTVSTALCSIIRANLCSVGQLRRLCT